MVDFYFQLKYNGRRVSSVLGELEGIKHGGGKVNFAEKLYNLRTQYGYSQEALAEKLNVSRQAISKWELGTTLPETDKMIVISDFFDVSIDYLLKDSISMNKDESLDHVIIKFLGSAHDMDEISRELVAIMRDGTCLLYISDAAY